MSHTLTDLKSFLESSPTAFHAAEQVGNRLAMLDFIPLDEREKWSLEKGKKYFVIRGGALAAFVMPDKKPTSVTLIGSHTDSPGLKVKPVPETNSSLFQLGVEVYGGPLLYSWLNRDLAIAGRVVVSDAHGNLETKLIFLDDIPCFIPGIAIHLEKEINEKGLLLNKQDHLPPIVGLQLEEGKHKESLETLIRRHLPFHTLLSFDLFLAPLEPARFLGTENEMIASYRLDNLSSAHAACHALAMATKTGQLQMGIFWDHEELGSRSAEGAASPFLTDTLKRIFLSYGMDEEDQIRCKNRSLCISVDVAHAFNPNYANKQDPNHRLLAGKGIAVKYNADQKYATNAPTAAAIINLCNRFNLPFQQHAAKSDLSSGSTVGPIVAHVAGIPTVDIGAPIFSMHSIREVMACKDHLDLCFLLTKALENESF
jgi:aspartyl aminopeptidase